MNLDAKYAKYTVQVAPHGTYTCCFKVSSYKHVDSVELENFEGRI